MDKERCNEYATRVTQANRSELVVVILEALSESIGDARKALSEQPVSSENIKEAYREIDRSRGFLTELMGSLDFHYAISYYLRRLYVYSYHELCMAKAEKSPEPLDHALKIADKLIPAFKEVAAQDDSEAVMQNTEAIYAGLTYGKGHLNENVDINSNGNRGFKA